MTKKKIAVIIFTFIFSLTILFGILPASAQDLVIVLDPGHGGRDPGADTKVDGKYFCEKDLNLAIALAVKEYLSSYKGVRVEMTRTGDIGDNKMENYERVYKASKFGANVMVSIHNNSSDNTSARGAEILVSYSKYRSDVAKVTRDLGNSILPKMEALGLSNRGLVQKMATSGSYIEFYPDGSEQDYYGIIMRALRANIPAVLIECAFISNDDEVRSFLSTSEKTKKLGYAIGEGLVKYYGLSKDSSYNAPSREKTDGCHIDFTKTSRSDLFYNYNGTTVSLSSSGAHVSGSKLSTYIDYFGMAPSASHNHAVLRMKAGTSGAKLKLFVGSGNVTEPDSDYCFNLTLSDEYKDYLINFDKLPDWDVSLNFMKFELSGSNDLYIEKIDVHDKGDSCDLSGNSSGETSAPATPTSKPTEAPATPTSKPTDEPTAVPTSESTPVSTSESTEIPNETPSFSEDVTETSSNTSLPYETSGNTDATSIPEKTPEAHNTAKIPDSESDNSNTNQGKKIPAVIPIVLGICIAICVVLLIKFTIKH